MWDIYFFFTSVTISLCVCYCVKAMLLQSSFCVTGGTSDGLTLHLTLHLTRIPRAQEYARRTTGLESLLRGCGDRRMPGISR